MSSIIAREHGTDMAALRRKLAGRSGRHYWRSLEELADSDDFQRLLEEEFPRLAPLWEGRVSRRASEKPSATCARPRNAGPARLIDETSDRPRGARR